MGTPRRYAIFPSAPNVINTLIEESTRALRLWSPGAQQIIVLGSLVLFLDHLREVWTGVSAMAPRPVVRIGVGTPWRVVIYAGASNVMSAFVVEFFHAHRRRLPLALRLIGEAAPDRVPVARPSAVTPIVLVKMIFVCVLIMVLAPRCIMVNRWTSSIHDTSPRKLRSASRRLFPSAIVILGGLDDSFPAARTSELALIITPRT